MNLITLLMDPDNRIPFKEFSDIVQAFQDEIKRLEREMEEQAEYYKKYLA